MGLAQGRALRGKIRGTRRVLARLEALRIEKPFWSPFPLFLLMAESRAARALGPALLERDPASLERMRGIAEGSGLRMETLHLVHSLEPFLTSLENRWSRPPLGACSAAAVRGARSAAGEPILARNFDYLPLVQPLYTVRESRPRGGLRSLEFTIAPVGGAVDGVNENGLCIALNYAFPADRAAPGPTITMAVAEALGRCATASEAAGLIAGRPRWGAGIVMLADATGDIASLELSNARTALRRPAAGEDVLVHTNCFSCEETREVELPRDAIFSGRVPRALRGVPVLSDHEARARRIAELLDGKGSLDPDSLAAVMADHGPTGIPGLASPCVHGPYWSTTACLQLFPRRREMRVAFSPACRARYSAMSL